MVRRVDERDLDTEEARAERARALRREIERLKSGEPDPEGHPRSPHEFVEERMRELSEEDEEQSEGES
jgi:hypothetical protein